VAFLPQTNGIAERANYSIYDHVRSILVKTQLPRSLLAELSAGVVNVSNRCPRGTTDEIALSKLYGQVKNLKLVPFRSLVVDYARTLNKLLLRGSKFYTAGYNERGISLCL
jgi:hypothetical protein